MQANRARRNRRGFTLVEVLIVVVILAILAMVIVPKFANSSQNARSAILDSDLRAIQRGLELGAELHSRRDLTAQIGMTRPLERGGRTHSRRPLQRAQHVAAHAAARARDQHRDHSGLSSASAASRRSRLDFCMVVSGSLSIGSGMRP